MRIAFTLLFVITNAVQASDPPADDESTWGPAAGGLASRLSLVTRQPALGKPIQLKLEVKNVGDKPASYDDQQAATNGSLSVVGPDGQPVPYVGGSYQTMGAKTVLQPGASKTIFATLELADQYLIDRPGNYTVQSRARGGVPASNKLTFLVGSGELGAFQKLFGELHRTTPKDWRIANYQGSIVFLSSPTGLKADSTSVSLLFTKDKANPVNARGKQPAAIDLGETTLGNAWLSAQDQAAVDRWPDYAKVIGERIKTIRK